MEVSESFIANVNQLVANLEIIKEAKDLFDEESIQRLEELSEIDISLITEDLKKSNYLGNRKIDIDLALNNNSDTEHVSYSGARLVLNDGTNLDIDFVTLLEDGVTEVTLELTSHADIKNYIANHTLYAANVINTELTVEDAIRTTPQLIRFRDADGSASNIDRVELTAYLGSFKEATPTYYWAKTTSSLQTLANRVGDVIALGQRIDKIIALADKEDEIQYLYNTRQNLQSLYDHIQKIIDVEANLDNIEGVNLNKTNIDSVANNKTNIDTVANDIASVQNVSNNMSTVLQVPEKTTQVIQIRDELIAINPKVVMIASNESASLSYDKNSGNYTLYMPQGLKGERGEAFNPDAVGTFANRSLYDAQGKDFSYLATDVQPSTIYFKRSDTAGDWDGGSPFGQGEKGEKGDTGVSITDISFTSTTDASGQAGQSGATDTYTITFSDTSTHTIQVYNGADMTNSSLVIDTVTNTTNVWSSQKVNNTINAKINDTTPAADKTYSSQKINELLSNMDTGDFMHSNTLGDVVIPANTNAAFINPVTFNSITVNDGAIVKLID
jgi:hypothetical protein